MPEHVIGEQFKCQGCGASIDHCYCYEDGAEDNSGCFECGGRGYRITCIDDLCYGQDECIHGDPPTPCRICNPKGDREDRLW